MTKLTFTDGQSFELDSKPHIEERADGLYVIGNGFLIPCNSEEEAKRLLNILQKPPKTKDHVLSRI